MRNLSKNLALALETPCSLAATITSAASGKVEYVIERYGPEVFLARMTSKMCLNKNGTALAETPWLALIKAHSELVERSTIDDMINNLQIDCANGAAASIYADFAAARAREEIVERDALVNFWLSCQYITDLTPNDSWDRLKQAIGFGLEANTYLVPSHEFYAVVTILTTVSPSGERRLHAVGCRASTEVQSAAHGAIQEAVMLALNDPSLSWPCPTFSRREQDAPLNKTYLRNLSLKQITTKKGSFHVHRIFSSALSGIQNGSAFVSAPSFRSLYGRYPPNLKIDIPYFTTHEKELAFAE